MVGREHSWQETDLLPVVAEMICVWLFFNGYRNWIIPGTALINNCPNWKLIDNFFLNMIFCYRWQQDKLITSIINEILYIIVSIFITSNNTDKMFFHFGGYIHVWVIELCFALQLMLFYWFCSFCEVTIFQIKNC